MLESVTGWSVDEAKTPNWPIHTITAIVMIAIFSCGIGFLATWHLGYIFGGMSVWTFWVIFIELPCLWGVIGQHKKPLV